jgi:sugar/nucleoside kinase (ribokinase family)
MDTENVLLHANAAGALTAARLGAQPSLPTIAEVRRFLHSRR